MASSFERLEELFHHAAELLPTERASFLDQLPPEDAELRAELEELLAADEETAAEAGLQRRVQEARELPEAPFFERPPCSPGDHIGPYRILRELGRGGLGTVFLADRDDREFSRRVALKVVRPGMESENVLERLRRERQILAELDHPNIARLFDGGATAEGLPYFAMEVIEGERIDSWCRKQGTPFRQRIEMLRKVCEAVHYAHRKLVLHRDLKPSNILVGENGEPKLLDFGIAKVLGSEGEAPASILAESPTLTETGHLFLTPEFASPEQVRGENLSTASDVYSLGVILYQLVTGSRPYEFDRRRFSELERVICQVEPARASEMARRFPELAAPGWQPAARGDDLDNILAMALRKEPERRYLSAADLAEDLRRYLEDLPVSARADTAGYRLRKFTRRHRWGVAASAAMILLLLATVVLTTWQARIARQERARAEGVANFLLEVFRVSDPYETLGNQITAREILDRGAARMKNDPGLSPDLRADLLETMGKVYRNLSVFEPAAGMLEEARQIRSAELSPQDPRRRHNLIELAKLELDRRRFEAALDLLEQTAEIAPGSWRAHPDELEVDHLRAQSLEGLNRFEEAEALLQSALAATREGEEAVKGKILNTLGTVAIRRQDPRLAEQYFREALAVRLEKFGQTHPEVADSRHNLALAFQDQGRLAEAETQYRLILEDYRSLFGERSTRVAISLLNLAAVRLFQRDPDGAETFYRESLEIRQEIYGADHVAQAEPWIGLARCSQMRANIARKAGDQEGFLRHLDVASQLATLASRLDRARYGDESLQALRDDYLLAELAWQKGEPEAEALFLRLVTILSTKYPEDPRLGTALMAVGRLRLARGNPLAAEEPLRAALKLLKSGMGRAEAEAQLAFCLEAQGRSVEALELVENALAVYESASPNSSTAEHLRALKARGGAKATP